MPICAASFCTHDTGETNERAGKSAGPETARGTPKNPAK
jgi:hypothetical protein